MVINYQINNFVAGNQCRMILKKFKKFKIPNHLSEFTKFLSNLNNLHKALNSKFLPHNYCEVIDKFSHSWYKLSEKFKLSTTPKMHIILDHLCNYLDETDLSLVKTSDEIVENCHQLFHKQVSKGFHVKDLKNPAHGNKMYNAVRSFNTYNLKINI